ncbi:MAG: alpha/beta hydrolase [Rhodocyclaceae bacterium]|nr:alpha/beta hydrolase [Rhodocyclaceae bacterium]MBX3667801.1 alpha/beta hydrolase [Rhodocyclaceae bacterium]
MAYTEWGDPGNRKVLVCAHGLTRVGRDFDHLAACMAAEYRVVCPDVFGRGNSDWLQDSSGYQIPAYVGDMVTLLARLDAAELHWVGTSMGGLIGMALACVADTPIQRLVLNDVGPVITVQALERIAQYVGAAPVFPSMEAAEQYIRLVSAPFGDLSDAEWRHLTLHSVRPASGGGFRMHYDPALAEPFRVAYGGGQDITLWPIYEAIRCPTLVVRGAQSDLLSSATLAEMAARGPRAQTVEIPRVGHAPMFLNDEQVRPVRDFLLGA